MSTHDVEPDPLCLHHSHSHLLSIFLPINNTHQAPKPPPPHSCLRRIPTTLTPSLPSPPDPKLSWILLKKPLNLWLTKGQQSTDIPRPTVVAGEFEGFSQMLGFHYHQQHQIEIECITKRIVLELGRLCTKCLVMFQVSYEGLPSWTDNDLRPLTNLLEGGDSSLPQSSSIWPDLLLLLRFGIRYFPPTIRIEADDLHSIVNMGF
ncbi:hypothetical protein L6452_15534 [Arctium lappa]|uniref:Uncharacterized protein n=1 Tax=Arctium lappa TaxID=4217 RepID=A0ACB9CNW1_ARCLA|nr:hypothetical protein L6452_15534 [Arctium lappa]